MPRLEVAHTDGPQRALALLLLHDEPALPPQLDDLSRGVALVVGCMDQVQVEVRRAQPLERVAF